MNVNRLFPCWAFLLTALCACNVAVSNQQQQEVRRSFDLDPGAVISLSNVSGDIRVLSWNENRAEMVAVKSGPADQLDQVDISIEASSSRLKIETKYPRMKNNRVSVGFDLKVPRNVSLDSIGSVSGNIDISGVDDGVDGHSVSGDVTERNIGGDAKAGSVSGDVRVTDAGGNVSAGSTSGNVYAENVRGDLQAKSVSGDVRIVRAGRQIHAESVSGDIAVGECTPSGIKASAVSGDIQFDGSLDAAGRYELKSHSGSVTVRLPRDSDFELEASSFSGSVGSDFEIKGARLDGKKTLKGIVGSGGPRLEAGSFSDDVSIQCR